MNKLAKLLISLVFFIGLINSEVLPANEKIFEIADNLMKNINDSDFIEAGKAIATFVEIFQEMKSEKSKSNLMNLFLANHELKLDDACLQLLEALVADAKTMLKHVFTDLNKVKEALDDFMNQIKNIPNVCLA